MVQEELNDIYEDIMIYTSIPQDILRYHRIFSHEIFFIFLQSEIFQIVEKWLWPFSMRCDWLNGLRRTERYLWVLFIHLRISQDVVLSNIFQSWNIFSLEIFELHDLFNWILYIGSLYATLNLSDFIKEKNM